MLTALRIHVDGIVQGVGFRPFVYRMAKRHLVNGWVLNAADGVTIHAEGDERLVDQFVLAISEEAPAAAQVKAIEMTEVPLQGFDFFEIRFSDESAVTETTLVSPDLATCDECLAELFNPKNRRYRYPFINCTNCGPRFTIIDSLPYDRPRTSMKGFTMCDACQHEYDHPENRRFHAQPDACFECGPHISWYEPGAAEEAVAPVADEEASEPIPAAARGRDTYEMAAKMRLVPAEPEGEETSIPAPSGVTRKASFASLMGGGMAIPASIPVTLTRASEEEPAAPCGGAPRASFMGSGIVTHSGSPAGVPPQGAAGGSSSAGAETGVKWGFTREESDAILSRAVRMLRAGKILAVKGLGGYHLVCDACNEETLAELRKRKRREGKAFAVMVADVDSARAWAQVSDEEAALLQSPARPIVLLKKRADVQYPAGLADRLPELGIMLPTTPLQHLLVRDFGGMLVMTSGNLHDEPIQTDDDQAREALAGVADAFIGNDRAILSRYDDSVVRLIRITGGITAVQSIRRARGYAPQVLSLPNPDGLTVFATGPEQKNTFTLVRGNEVFVSQHIGDMENAETYDAWIEAKQTYERLFEAQPVLVAADLHPEYLTSKWASGQELPVEQVQHHHAHVAAVMGENNLDEAVCGIAFDGTGYGPDGAIWGGEVLLANRSTYERFANFAYVPMPGGAAAIKHPLRMAYGVLWEFDLLEHPGAQDAIAALGQAAPICEQMIERGLNTPYTSSVGRLFDAASAILGVCVEPTYEGEGAILLEAALSGLPENDEGDEGYHLSIVKNTAGEDSTALDTSVVLFDAASVFEAMLDDKQAGVPVPVIARRFHDAFVEGIVQVAQLVDMMYGIHLVTLSGGVFMNRYLLEHAASLLANGGFSVAINRELPPNDASVSFGQAVVALARNTQTA
ncbi:MAG: carbamoyltransferase HypF [Coriobacteriia bacterium]|nr:carbamoyltransferase HypF [Coriobacteriia bacterium]